MMTIPFPNRPTFDALRHMQIGEIVNLPGEYLALLQADARDAVDAAKRMQDWIEAAVTLRYEQRAKEVRSQAGKDTGVVHFQDGVVEVTADLAKRVQWDQPRLAALAEQIRASGEDPSEYLEISFKVSERAYMVWPEYIRKLFEPARTVRTGKSTFKLSLDTARGGV